MAFVPVSRILGSDPPGTLSRREQADALIEEALANIPIESQSTRALTQTLSSIPSRNSHQPKSHWTSSDNQP
jgi:hypothetical protein